MCIYLPYCTYFPYLSHERASECRVGIRPRRPSGRHFVLRCEVKVHYVYTTETERQEFKGQKSEGTSTVAVFSYTGGNVRYGRYTSGREAWG